MKFTIPYFQNHKPLVFTDSAGGKTEVNSFGIRYEDDFAYYELRRQPAILFSASGGGRQLTEFIVDLDRTSQPNQIVLAFIEPRPTLAAMLESIDDKIAKAQKEKQHALFSNDVLLVPDMVWRISHRFTQLEGNVFKNENLKGQRIDVAQQDIQFRLDRSGAELKSEAKICYEPIPICYIFNHPFLLYMKMRDANMPYFVMWVENAELLSQYIANSLLHSPEGEADF